MRNVITIALNDLRIFFGARGNLVGLVVIPGILTLAIGFFYPIGDGEGIGIELVEGYPAQVVTSQTLGFAAEPQAVKGVQAHVKVSECVLDDAQQVIDLNLDGKLFLDFPLQTRQEILAGSAFASGEFP